MGSTHTGVTQDDAINLDDILADLEIEEIVEAAGADSQVEETVEEIQDISVDEIDAIAAEEVVAKAMAGAHAEQDKPETGDLRRAQKAAKVASPKTERNLEALTAENFVLTTVAAQEIADGKVELEGVKKHVLALRPKQTKVAEKFDNLLASVAAGRSPSVYTKLAIELLVARKEITSADLIAHLKAAKYSDGTARAQAGQMFALLPVLQIGIRSGNKMTLNPTSTIAIAFEA